MNQNLFVKICCLLFVTLNVMSVEAAETTDPEFTYQNPTDDEFPILGSCAFETPDLVTPENFRIMRQCGFNLMESAFATEDAIENAIYASRGSGIRILLSTPGVEKSSTIAQTVRKYKDVPEIMGYLLSDEPSAKLVRAWRVRRDTVLQISPDQYPFITLLPNYATPELWGTSDYRQYLEAFADTVELPILSYDNYPFIRKNGITFLREDYFDNLETAHDVAKSHNVPLWTYILSSTHLDYAKPTEAHLMFEAFSGLAYGSQGLLYYTYGMPPAFHKIVYKDTPIDGKGKKSETWYKVRKVNRTVQSLAKVFLGADFDRIRHTGTKIPIGTTPLVQSDLPAEFNSIRSQGTGIIVSIFHNNGNNYLMLVNKDFNHSQKIDVDKSDSVKRVISDGHVQSDNRRKITLPPGGFYIYTW